MSTPFRLDDLLAPDTAFRLDDLLSPEPVVEPVRPAPVGSAFHLGIGRMVAPTSVRDLWAPEPAPARVAPVVAPGPVTLPRATSAFDLGTVARPAPVPADDEPAFQSWYAQRAGALGLDPNPDSPLHFYDYRAAHRAGAEPDASGHWPSEFKREGHPNQFVAGTDSRTGQPVQAFQPPAPAAADVSRVRPSIDLAALAVPQTPPAIARQRDYAEQDIPVEYALKTAKELSSLPTLVARALGRDVGARFLLQGAQKLMDLAGGPLGLEADPRLRRIVGLANAQREAEIAGKPGVAQELTRGLIELLAEMELIPGAGTPSRVARFGPRVMAEVGTAERTIAAPVLKALGRAPEYVRGAVVENLPGTAASRIARRAAEDAARFGYVEGYVAPAQEPDVASAAARQRAGAAAGAVLGGGLQAIGEIASKGLQSAVMRAARRNLPPGGGDGGGDGGVAQPRLGLPAPGARPVPEPPRPTPVVPEPVPVAPRPEVVSQAAPAPSVAPVGRAPDVASVASPAPSAPAVARPRDSFVGRPSPQDINLPVQTRGGLRHMEVFPAGSVVGPAGTDNVHWIRTPNGDVQWVHGDAIPETLKPNMEGAPPPFEFPSRSTAPPAPSAPAAGVERLADELTRPTTADDIARLLAEPPRSLTPVQLAEREAHSRAVSERGSRLAQARRRSIEAEMPLGEVQDRFHEVAMAQRGAPEGAMGEIQRAPIPDERYSHLAEHAGDLTNRIWKKGHYGGFKYARTKVTTALGALDDLIREGVPAYLARNRNLSGEALDAAVRDLRERGVRYAESHAALPALNEPMSIVREAAVAIGEMDFPRARQLLSGVKRQIDRGDDAFRRWALEPPAPSAPAAGLEPWQMTREEFHVADVTPKVEAIQTAIRQGRDIVLATNTRATRLAAPEHIRVSPDGTVRIPSGRTWLALTGDQVDALAGQAGVPSVPLSERVYHHAAVEEALAQGKPVPPEVLAQYPDLAPAAPEPIAPSAPFALDDLLSETPPASAPVEAVAPLTPEEIPTFIQREGYVKPEPPAWVDPETLDFDGKPLSPEALAERRAIGAEMAREQAKAPRTSEILRMPTASLEMDPERFQFKTLGPEGVGRELKGVQVWNDELAGVVHVWKDPVDGKTYVVNGHHRVDLARRLNVESLNVRYVNAPTAEAARARGAFMNIAEGRGTPIDAAKFFRDAGATPETLASLGVSLRADLARNGLALSNLAPDIFDQVAAGKVSQAWGAGIGDVLAGNPDLQRAALAAVTASGTRLSEAEVRQVAAQIRDEQTEGVTQETLFGAETRQESLYVPKAQLVTALLKRVGTDRRLFGPLAKEGRAAELARAGSTQIDVGAAKDLADESARVGEVFGSLYTRKGPIADLVTEGARRVARGEKPGTVASDIYSAVAAAVTDELKSRGLRGTGTGRSGGAPTPSGVASQATVAAPTPEPEPTGIAGVDYRPQDSVDPAQAGMFGEPEAPKPTAPQVVAPPVVAPTPAGGVLPDTRPDLTNPQVAAAAREFAKRPAGQPAISPEEAGVAVPSPADEFDQATVRRPGGVQEETAGYGEPAAPTRNPALDIGTGQFYSRVVRGVEDAKLIKATGAVWDAYLSKQPMLREEYEYTLQPWLRENADAKLTKEQVVAAAQERQIRLTETVLGAGKSLTELPSGYYVETHPASRGMETFGVYAPGSSETGAPPVGVAYSLEQAIQNALHRLNSMASGAEPRHATYVEPGGTNYREVVISLDRPETKPDRVRPSTTAIAAFDGEWAQQAAQRNILDRALADGRVSQADYEAQRDQIEAVFDTLHRQMVDRTLEEARAAGTPLRDGPPYHSSHWGGIDNPLVHIRLSDRVGPNGEKVLFVEEAQSDWHQRGREQGYQGEQRRALEGQIRALGLDPQRASIDTITQAGGSQELASAWYDAVIRHGDTVPNAPFKKTEDWLGLAWRRIVDEAVAGGYDRISWTTGAQQAARYDLSKKVRDIEYDGNRLVARGHEGGEEIDKRAVAPEDLPGIIGKEAAQRLLATEDRSPIQWEEGPTENDLDGGKRRALRALGHGQNDRWATIRGSDTSRTWQVKVTRVPNPTELFRTLDAAKAYAEKLLRPPMHLEGEDLQVGGEGMQAFYDQMFPNVVRAWAKRRGVKVAVEPVALTRYEIQDLGGDALYQYDPSKGADYGITEDGKESGFVGTKAEVEAEIARLQSETTVPSIRVTPEMRQSLRERGHEIAEKSTPYGETVQQGNLFGAAETTGPTGTRDLFPEDRPSTPSSATAEAKATVQRKLKPEEVKGGRLGLTTGEVEPRDLPGERPLTLLEPAQPYAPPPAGSLAAKDTKVVFGSPKARERAAKLGLDANRVQTYDERRQVIPTGKKTWVDVRGKQLDGPQSTAMVARPFRSPQAETLEAILKDDKGTILSREAVSSGAINYVDLDLPRDNVATAKAIQRGDLPRWLATLAMRAERVGATELEWVHNHPSGNATPSLGDKVFTRDTARLFAASRVGQKLKVTGHTVTDFDTATVIRPIASDMATGEVGGVMTEVVAITPPASDGPDWTEGRGPQVSTAATAAQVVGHVADNEILAIYRDNSGRAVALVPHRASAAATVETWVRQEAQALGAVDAILVVPSTDVSLWRRLTVNAPGEVRDVIGLDHTSGVYDSAQRRGLVGQERSGNEPGRRARHVVGEGEPALYGEGPVPTGWGAGALRGSAGEAAPVAKTPQQWVDEVASDPKWLDKTDAEIRNEARRRAKEPVPTPEEDNTVSLKKADAADIRERLGLDALAAPMRQSFQMAWDQATTEKLADTITGLARLSPPRALTPVEHAAAVQRYLQLERDLSASRASLAEAAQQGEQVLVDRETGRSLQILEEIDQLTRLTDRAGTEAGRNLSVRHLRANRDTFDLATGLQYARTRKGSALSPEEVGRIEAATTRVKELEDQNATLREANDALTSERDKALAASVVSITRQRRTPQAVARILDDRTKILKALEALGTRLNDFVGASLESSYLIGKLAVSHIQEQVAAGAERVALDHVVEAVLADLHNPSITARDIYQALGTQHPKELARAQGAAQNQVRDLKTQARLLVEIEQAEAGLFTPKKTAPGQASDEVRALQKRLAQLRVLAYQTARDGAKLEHAVQTINELEEHLEQHTRPVRKTAPQTPPDLAALRTQIRGLRQEMRVEDTLTDIQEQLRTGVFKMPVPRTSGYTSPALERNQIALARARRDWRAVIESMQPMTAGKVANRIASELRTLQATADLSATLRQGLIPSVRHPVIALHAFAGQVRAFFSEHSADQIDNAIRQSPMQPLRDRAKLALTDTGNQLTHREEYFASHLAERIPVYGALVRGSDRAMSTDLNLIRTAVFDWFANKYPNATDAELAAWADWVNVTTGRGSMGRLAVAGDVLSTVFFAPRFAVSRFQAPTMLFKYWKEPRVRKEIAKDYAAFLGVGLTALALAAAAGATVGLDPRNSDFGKIRIGDTRIDIWGGMLQPFRLLARLVLGATDRVGLTGQDLPASKKALDPLALLGQFASFKLSPMVTVPVELYRGKDVIGQPQTPTQTALSVVTPMVVSDAVDAYRSDGAGGALLFGGLAFLGAGASTYTPRPPQRSGSGSPFRRPPARPSRPWR